MLVSPSRILNYQPKVYTRTLLGGLKTSPLVSNLFSSLIPDQKTLTTLALSNDFKIKKKPLDNKNFEITDDIKSNETPITEVVKNKIWIIENGRAVNFDPQKFIDSVKGFSKVHVDLGTGDAKFVYRQAKANPNIFFVGIDTNPGGLSAMSIKVNKKPSKGGGITNVAFIQAHAECLPEELDSIADSISINFPWSGLLEAVIQPDSLKLRKISNLGKNNCPLKILINNDVLKDEVLCKKINLPNIDEFYIKNKIIPKYRNSSISLKSYNITQSTQDNTTWGKKLTLGSNRTTLVFNCIISRIQ